MADVDIKYKGSSIATMNASGTKALQTSGKYCEGNIEVVYAAPEKPTQSKTVTPTAIGFTVSPDSGKVLSSVVVNGDADLISANVRKGKNIFGVDGSMEEGITPSGTKDITANGNGIDVTQYAAVNVNVPQGAVNCKRFEVSIASDKGSEWVTMISADNDLKTHRADDSLMIMWRRKNIPSGDTTFVHSGRAVNGWFSGSSTTNTPRQNATRINSSGIGAAVNINFDMYSEKTTIAQATVGCIYIDADGNLQMQSNASYHIKSGDYEFVVSW